MPDANQVKLRNFETVANFKYIVTAVSNDGLSPDVASRVSKAIAALTKLKLFQKDNNIRGLSLQFVDSSFFILMRIIEKSLFIWIHLFFFYHFSLCFKYVPSRVAHSSYHRNEQ